MEELKKCLFVDGSRGHGAVVLNWVGTPEREFTWYGEAFHEAGKSLVEQLRNDQRFGLGGPPPNSFKAVPIVYMYRHAMELYLKGVILAGAEVLPLRGNAELDLKAVLKTHSLQRLLQDVERIFKAFGWDWDFKLPRFRSLADFQSAIGELDAVDAQSFAFRYPTQRDGRSPALRSHFRFNLFEFCEILDPVYPVLDGAAYGAYEQLQQEYEARAEARQCELENADQGGNYESPDYEPDYDCGDVYE